MSSDFSLRTLLGALLLSLASLPAMAQDDDDNDDGGKNRDDPTYQSIRLTAVESDFDNLDRAVNLGFTLGVRIPGVERYLAAELDISSTLIPGENAGPAPVFGGGSGGGDDGGLGLPGGLDDLLGGGDGGGGGGGGGSSANNTSDADDLRLNSIGIFAAGRTPGRFFGSARIGYRFVESSINELNEEQTGEAYGAGIGYRYGEWGLVELTYTRYSSELDYLSLAVSF